MGRKHKFIIAAMCFLSLGLVMTPFMVKHALADSVKKCSNNATGNPIVAGRDLYCSFYFNIDGLKSQPPISAKTAFWNWPDAYQDNHSGSIDDPSKDDAGSLTNWMHGHLNICGNPFRVDQCPDAGTNDVVFQQALATVVGDSYIVNTQLGRVGNDFLPPDNNTYCKPYGGIYKEGVFCGIKYAQDNFTAWKALVTQYDANHQIDWFDTLYGTDVKNIPTGACDHSDTLIYAYGIQPYGQFTDEIAYDNSECGQGNYIAFKDPTGHILYRINRDCGNVTGTIQPLIPISNTITLTAKPAQPDLVSPADAPKKAGFPWSVTAGGTPPDHIHKVPVKYYYYADPQIGDNRPMDGTSSTTINNNFDIDNGALTISSTSNKPFYGPFDIPGTQLVEGDRVCETILAPDKVDIDPSSGNVISYEPSNPDDFTNGGKQCQPVLGFPYLSMYGNDVFAGGGVSINSTCTPSPTAANIVGWILTSPSYQGAGTQFANYATGQIGYAFSGFNSAKLRSSSGPAAKPPDGLEIGNKPTLGGFSTSAATCSKYSFNPNKYNATKLGAADGSPTDESVTQLNGLTGTYYQTIGDLDITNSAARQIKSGPGATHLVIFVKGNLVIKKNITYDTSNWTDPASIPSLTFIVKGNIYIAHDNVDGVTAMDGNYIAEQANSGDPIIGDGSTGSIFTCTKSEGPNYLLSLDSIDNLCNSQLIVHGRFIAHAIFWLRSNGTLSLAQSDLGVDPYKHPEDTQAGEVIISGPEDYVSAPTGSNLNPGYDSITGLPPVL